MGRLKKIESNKTRTNLFIIIFIFLTLIIFLFLFFLFLHFLSVFSLDDFFFPASGFSSVCSNIFFMFSLQLSNFLFIKLLVVCSCLFHISPSFFETSSLERPGCSPLFGVILRSEPKKKKKAKGGFLIHWDT